MASDAVLRVGQLSKEKAHEMILRGDLPVVFENMISEWPAKHWTASFLCKRYPKMVTKFRVCKLRPIFERDRPVKETDCEFVEATLNDFLMWLEGNQSPGNPFEKYSRSENSIYADYKYMHELFQNQPEILQAVDWSVFGFHGRRGNDSTIWIGSSGAFTPCHQDCYGFNLVAQLSGSKMWTLFCPEDSEKMYPTRIPYEESSIFSSVNLKGPNFIKHPKFKDAKKYEVTLKAGDVLHVPKHWWHFVENLEPSVSVNTWIEVKNDAKDRVREAITRTLVCSLRESEKASCSAWLNPNEEIYSHEINMNYLSMALEKLMLTNESQNSDTCEIDILQNRLSTGELIDCLVSRNVLNALVTELKSRFVS